MHILQPYFRVVVASAKDFEEAKKQNFPEIFMITSDGVYKHHRVGDIGSDRYVCAKVPNIPGYELMVPPRQEVKFMPDGKVPGELFDQIVALYREVMRVNNNRNLEAMAWILWNKDDGYFIHVPKQQVSGASVSYDWDIPAGSTVIVDTHSHNSMGAFFSGTDDGDDRKGVRYSGVVGKLTNNSFEMVWRFCYQGKFFDAKFDDIFAPGRVEVNPEWLGKIETNSWSNYPGYGSYHGRGGHQSGSSGHSTSSSSSSSSNANTNSTTRGRADHLKQYQFQPGGGRANDAANGAGSGTGGTTTGATNGMPNQRPHEDAHDFDRQYEEYYSRMSRGSMAEANQPTPRGRPVYDQSARTATTIDPSAYDSSSRFQREANNESKVQENLGNAQAGTTTDSSKAVTVVPAKGGEAVIVGLDGQPLTSTSEKLTTAQSLLQEMEKVHGETETSGKPVSDEAKGDWSRWPTSKDFVDAGDGKLVPMGGPKSGELKGTLADDILSRVPELSEEEADEVLRRLATNAMWESGDGFDLEGLREAGFIGGATGEEVAGERGASEHGLGVDISGMEGHPRFDDIAINYGVPVANAFCLINELSAEFTDNCDDLIAEIAGDFFQLLSEDSALAVFRQLYELLSARAQADINAKGI